MSENQSTPPSEPVTGRQLEQARELAAEMHGTPADYEQHIRAAERP